MWQASTPPAQWEAPVRFRRSTIGGSVGTETNLELLPLELLTKGLSPSHVEAVAGSLAQDASNPRCGGSSQGDGDLARVGCVDIVFDGSDACAHDEDSLVR